MCHALNRHENSMMNSKFNENSKNSMTVLPLMISVLKVTHKNIFLINITTSLSM